MDAPLPRPPDSPSSSQKGSSSGRRSWFSSSPGPNKPIQFSIAMDTAPRYRDDNDENEVEYLELTHFSRPPRLDFGEIRTGKTVTRTMVVRNPHDYEQQVELEKLPTKKSFTADLVEFSVDPGESVPVTFTWTPTEAMRCREMVLLKVDDAYRLQAILLGQATEPPKPKKRGALRGRSSAASSRRPAGRGRPVLGERVDNTANTRCVANTGGKPGGKIGPGGRKSLVDGQYAKKIPAIVEKDIIGSHPRPLLVPNDPSLTALEDTPTRRGTFIKDDPTLPDTPVRRTTFQKDDPELPETPVRRNTFQVNDPTLPEGGRTSFQKEDPDLPLTPIRRETFLKKGTAFSHHSRQTAGNLENAAKRLSTIAAAADYDDDEDDRFMLERTPGNLRRSLTYTKLNVSRSPKPNIIPDSPEVVEPEEVANLSPASSQYFTPMETPHGSDSEGEDRFQDSVMYLQGQEPMTPDPHHVTILDAMTPTNVVGTCFSSGADVVVTETVSTTAVETVTTVIVEEKIIVQEEDVIEEVVENIYEQVETSHAALDIPKSASMNLTHSVEMPKTPAKDLISCAITTVTESEEVVSEVRVESNTENIIHIQVEKDEYCANIIPRIVEPAQDLNGTHILSRPQPNLPSEGPTSSLDSWLEKGGAHLQQEISPRLIFEGSFSHRQVIDKLETVKVELESRLSSTPLARPISIIPEEDDFLSQARIRSLPAKTPSPIIGRRVSGDTVSKERPSLTLLSRAMDPKLRIDDLPNEEPKRQLFSDTKTIEKSDVTKVLDKPSVLDSAAVCNHHGHQHIALQSALADQAGILANPSQSPHKGVPLLLKMASPNVSPRKRAHSADREAPRSRLTAPTEASRKKMKSDATAAKMKPMEMASRPLGDGAKSVQDDRTMTKTMRLRRQAALNNTKKTDNKQQKAKPLPKSLNSARTSKPNQPSVKPAPTSGRLAAPSKSAPSIAATKRKSPVSKKEIVKPAARTSTVTKTSKPAGTKDRGVIKRPAQGLAQSKLTLIRPKQTTAMPKHPLAFAAKNTYYDERWMEKQERGFVMWLNFVLTPPEEFNMAASSKLKVDAGKLLLDPAPRSSNAPLNTTHLAPTKEQLSFRAYSARRRMNRLRRAACLLYQREDMVSVISKLEREVELGRIKIRTDRKIYADLGIKQKVLDMLLCYNPLWLRIGLETIYGEVIPMASNTDVLTLSRFIVTRLLANPDIAQTYAHTTVPHLYRDGYDEELSRFTLKKFLLFVLLVDHAKRARIIDHDPCLFCVHAEFKASRDILLVFSRDYLSGEGDLTRHLSYFGYTVSHAQTALEEFDFAVSNLATDLRCGLRITRVMELLTQKWSLSRDLRVPAISRLQKIHNVDLAMRVLHDRGVTLKTSTGLDIDSRSIVDGHRQKTLALLWLVIVHFQVDALVSVDQLRDEIAFLTRNRRYKKTLANLLHTEDSCLTPDRPSSQDPDLYSRSERLSLLLRWTQAVCALYGLRVHNFTVSFSDGRALCYLLHHYQPGLLPLDRVRTNTTLSFKGSQGDEDDSSEDSDDGDWTRTVKGANGVPSVFEELLANEKENFKLLYEKISELGGVPFMVRHADMSNTIPDEKLVVTFVTYLCSRLLDIRREVRAARVIQAAWRQHHLRAHRDRYQAQTSAAIVIQRSWRMCLTRRRDQERLVAVMLLQGQWRCVAARIRAQRLLVEKQRAKEDSAASCIQKCARSFLERLYQRKVQQATITIQAIWRGQAVRRLLQRQNQAALVIQTHYWNYKITQTIRKQYLVKQQAAVIVQSVIRGFLARKLVKKIESVVKIQAMCRMMVQRKAYLDQRAKATMIASWWKMVLERRRFIRVKTAVCKIQEQFRAELVCRKCRLGFVRLKAAAVVLQRHYRQKKLVEYEKSVRAATMIQAWYRGITEQRKFNAFKDIVTFVQRKWRATRITRNEMMQYHVKRGATIAMQSCVRRFLVQRRMLRSHQAATKIQACYRMHKARMQYIEQQNSCATIQRWFRACMMARVEESMKYYNKCRAATKIQACYRMHVARMQYQEQQKSCVTIQRWYRACMMARAEESMKFYAKCQAATKIQASFRMHIARMEYRKQQDSCMTIQRWFRGCMIDRAKDSMMYAAKCKAATKIQACYRMYLAQMQYRKLTETCIIVQRRFRARMLARAEESLEYIARMEAATKIQACYRMHAAKLQYRKQQDACVTIQRRFRACMMARAEESMNMIIRCKAATKIQACYRMHKDRTQFKRQLAACSAIQEWYRGLMLTSALQSTFLLARCQATKIQSVFRGHICRKQFLAQKHAAVCLQANWRRFACRQHFLAQCKAAVVIQQRWRATLIGREAAKAFQVVRNASITVQAVIRGHQARQHVRRIRAAICIQATWKSYAQRKSFVTKKQAVVRIQSCVRMRQQRVKYETLRQAAIVIQNRWRTILMSRVQQNWLRIMNEAATTLQAGVKGWLQRSRYMRERASIITAQAVVRSYLCRKELARRQQAATVIQIRWRAELLANETQQQFLQTKRATLKLQAGCRQYLQRRKYSKMVNGFTKLQAIIKGRFQQHKFQKLQQAVHIIGTRYGAVLEGRAARKAFHVHKGAVITIQAFTRGFLARKFARKVRATVMIQKQWRMITTRRKYLKIKSGFIALQALVKAKQQRKVYLLKKNAACKIQKQYRAVLLARKVQNVYTDTRNAIITIQSVFRGFKDRQYVRKIRAAICIQKQWRMIAARTRYLKIKTGFTALQAVVKAKQQRNVYLLKKNAACKIQKRYRAVMLARKVKREYKEARNAIITIQSAVRGFKARQYVRKIRAAICIQKQWRMIAARSRYLKIKSGVTALQAVVKAKQQRNVYLLKKNAACKIQKRYRAVMLARKVKSEYKDTRNAIITIQSAVRGFKARQYVRKIRAAICIQKQWRMIATRTRYLKIKSGFTALQAVVKAKQQRNVFLLKKNAACKIQKRYRAVTLARKVQSEYKGTRNAIITIQSAIRGFRARQYVRKVRATICIQKQWKMKVEQTKYHCTRMNVILIQAQARMMLARKRFQEQIHAATVLQRRWRALLLMRQDLKRYHLMVGAAITIQCAYKGYKERCRFAAVKIGITKLQALVRGQQQRKRYLQQKQAACVVQRWYRAMTMAQQVRQDFARHYAAIIVLQSAIRGYRARKYVQKVRAAIMIQKSWRMIQERRLFLTKKAAVVKLQSHARKISGRREFLRKKAATVIIQHHLRATLEMQKTRKQYHICIGAAITIQSAFRAYKQRNLYCKLKNGIIKCQAQFRRHQQQKKYQQMRSAACIIQARFRATVQARQVQEVFHRNKSAAVTIQRTFRQHVIRKQQRRTVAATTIQSVWRSYIKRKSYNHTRCSAALIQSKVRMLICRRQYQRLLEATRILQDRWRATLQKRQVQSQFVAMKRACVTIQAAYRAHHQRQEYLKILTGFIKLQAVVRCKQQQKRYQRIKKAALICQKHWRAVREGRKVCNEFKGQKAACLRIQTWFRMVRQKSIYKSDMSKIVQIQSIIRGRLQRIRFRRIKLATAVLQKNVRVYQKRRSLQIEYERTCAASVVLQTYTRGMLARKRYRQERAATCIQRYWKMVQQRRQFKTLKKAVLLVQGRYCTKKAVKQFTTIKQTTVNMQRRIRSIIIARRIRQEFIQKRQSACTIQKWWHRILEVRRTRRTEAATRIQAVVRMYRERRTYIQMRSKVVRVQAVIRGYLVRRSFKVTVTEVRAARVIQTAYRKHTARKHEQAVVHRRRSYLTRYSSVVKRHLCVITLQRAWRRHRLLVAASNKMAAIVTLQRWLRARIERLRFLRVQHSVSVLQRASRRYLRRKHMAATRVQVCVRAWLGRRRAERREYAATRIQSVWRGACVRWSVKDKKVRKVRQRIAAATARATDDMRLCNRTRSALDYLLQCKQLALVLEAVMNLDASTRLSPRCCEWLIDEQAQCVLYTLIRGCNRSLPHMEIIKYTVNIFLNLAKYEKTRCAVYSVPESIETLLELMMIYRDKGAIFTKTCTLLGLLCNDPHRRREVLGVAKYVDKIQSIHALTSRKHKMEEQRARVKSKMAASKCTGIPKLSPSKHLRLRPAWYARRDSMTQIDDPMQAINFVLANLRLAPK